MRLMSMYEDELDQEMNGNNEGSKNNDVNKTEKAQMNGKDEHGGAKGSRLSDKNLDEIKLSDLPWGARWLEFVGGVSIVGLRYAVDPGSANTRRFLWTLFVLLGVGFMTYQIYER